MHHGHHKLWTLMPSITVPSEEMMLRGHNDFNASRAKPGAKQFENASMDPESKTDFKARFNVGNSRLKEIFSASPAA